MATTELEQPLAIGSAREDEDIAPLEHAAPEPSAAHAVRRWPWVLDRTAALALGLLAGFLIGLSFNQAGREQVWGWFFPGDAPAVALAAPVAGSAAAPTRPQSLALPGTIDPRVIQRVAVDGVIHVGVFGDSFGDGVWAALYHQLPPKQHFEVLRFSKEATGFTRYRTLNLEDRARTQLAHQPIDVAVISFGANDVQPIFNDGHLQPLLSEGWKKVIGERIDRFVAVARSTGAAVFWIGLPAMRDKNMDDEIVAMDAFYAQRMRTLGVPYFETRSRSVDRAGGYSPYLPDSVTGEPRLMRANDGIHMSMLGYQRLTTELAARLRDYAGTLRAKAAASGPQSPALREAMAAPAHRANATPKPAATPTPKPSASPKPRRSDEDEATAHANRHEKRCEEDREDAPRRPRPKPTHAAADDE